MKLEIVARRGDESDFDYIIKANDDRYIVFMSREREYAVLTKLWYGALLARGYWDDFSGAPEDVFSFEDIKKFEKIAALPPSDDDRMAHRFGG